METRRPRGLSSICAEDAKSCYLKEKKDDIALYPGFNEGQLGHQMT